MEFQALFTHDDNIKARSRVPDESLWDVLTQYKATRKGNRGAFLILQKKKEAFVYPN